MSCAGRDRAKPRVERIIRFLLELPSVLRWRMVPSLAGSPKHDKLEKLLEELRDLRRLRHYSIRNEFAVVASGIVRFIRFGSFAPLNQPLGRPV